MLGVPLVDCDLHLSTLLLANSQAVMVMTFVPHAIHVVCGYHSNVYVWLTVIV